MLRVRSCGAVARRCSCVNDTRQRSLDGGGSLCCPNGRVEGGMGLVHQGKGSVTS